MTAHAPLPPKEPSRSIDLGARLPPSYSDASYLRGHSSCDEALAPEARRTIADILAQAEQMLCHDPDQARFLIEQARNLVVPDEEAPPPARTDGRPAGGLALWQVRRVLDHVQRTLHGTIRIENLAALCGLSPSHFSRAFKRTMGATPQACVNDMRFRRAQDLMLESDASLSEIAIACGFYDQAHLCKQFRQMARQSPNAWRRERMVAGGHVFPGERKAG